MWRFVCEKGACFPCVDLRSIPIIVFLDLLFFEKECSASWLGGHVLHHGV